jgi:hypothetical protein
MIWDGGGGDAAMAYYKGNGCVTIRLVRSYMKARNVLVIRSGAVAREDWCAMMKAWVWDGNSEVYHIATSPSAGKSVGARACVYVNWA